MTRPHPPPPPAYRELFALWAGASVLVANLILFIPHRPAVADA